jgi:hypothetical protein
MRIYESSNYKETQNYTGKAVRADFSAAFGTAAAAAMPIKPTIPEGFASGARRVHENLS